ncbi:MAG: NAD(P)-binding protein [Rhodospirillaceae bacterium]|nr:NAD(P)-binding protein [Rhodospirillaceae bacterium]MBT4687931.1 NAD(P)-binding protein [Rhodospirillaceae bacterium]MBT5079437.1 NAD(P)-binding protein [Rhodospirillaceae bacterium]MBT5878448.1 NAD(P)-binding protein [Rhodospirillaceae bacterium]MBT6590112.1 NAD(P)-binding protein [Rhodospirillaceae bacterium]
MKKAIVVGGGMTGCTWAHLLSEKGWEVLLLEGDKILGGGCRTMHYGGHPYTFGPRHLFTDKAHIFEYYDKYVPQRRLAHYLLTYVERDQEFYSYPIHHDDIARMPDRDEVQAQLDNRGDPGAAKNFEEYWINSVGEILYDKFVRHYSKKMWQIEENTVLDDFKFDGKGVGLSEGSHEVRPDIFISYPISLGGWDDYVDMCASAENVEARTGVFVSEFDLNKPAVKVGEDWLECDLLVSTISPDIVLRHAYGELNYIGRDFIPIVLPCKQVIPDPTFFLHYAGQETYTRIVEYKKLTGYQSEQTLIGLEIPSTRNKLYPYPIKAEQARAQKYIDEIRSDKVLSVGRLGNYRYMDIGLVTDEALQKIDEI